MLKTFLLSFLLLTSILNAKELSNEKFQLIAKEIDSKNNIVKARGNVVIFSPTYYISASKVIYDKEKETFELFDNVLILKDNTIQTQSDYAFINLNNESYSQSPVLLFEKNSNLWLNSKSSSKVNQNIELESSIISSCDCVNPAWSIRVSSASYDLKDKWLHAYNPRLYIKNIPVFYSPYLGFPTDKTRRTGLLSPTLGYSNSEGIHYSQAIFYAPADNYDFEFIPQYRSKRGFGSYTYFRYKDSPYSLLKIKSGIFRENKDYQREFSLKNQKHYGVNLEYTRTKLFSSGDTQDGLYASINILNDIEYQTLEEDDDNSSSDKKVESKINYFYNTPAIYAGIYGRYYIDTEENSNDATLQKLPELQFHTYNKNIFFENLIYSLDTKYSNYTRDDGINANIYEFSLPLNYNKYFFDDYMYLNIENEIILKKLKYSNTNTNFKDGSLIQNLLTVSLGTDLVKPYDNYLHAINLNASYSHPSNSKLSGDIYGINTNNEDNYYDELSSFELSDSQKEILVSVNQFFYSSDTLKQVVNHKLSQSIMYDNITDNAELQNLENYIKVNHDYGSVSSRLIYNMEDKQFIENSADLTLSYKDLSFTAGYYKSKDTDNSGKEDLESYRINTSYKFKKDYKISYYENHNILEDVRNKQGLSLSIEDRCWNINLKYEKEVVPVTSDSSDTIEQKIIYINIELKPLGKVKQNYEVEAK